MSADPVVVTITRARLNRHRVAPCERVIRFTYSWTASDNGHMREMPNGRVVDLGSYGTHLASLRDMLRRKYRGQRLVIREAWRTPV